MNNVDNYKERVLEIHLPLSKHVSELGHCVRCVEFHPECPRRNSQKGSDDSSKPTTYL